MTSFAAFGIAPAAGVGGMIEFPLLGAFFGWFLVAALVGSALGVLNRMGGTTAAAAGTQGVDMAPADDVAADHFHKEAA